MVAAAAGVNPQRPPLIPSEKDNAGAAALPNARRRSAKEVTSRYLSSSSSSSSLTSTSTSTSTSYSSSSSSTFTTTSTSRRFPSPLAAARPSPLARSLDCSLDRKDSILATVHLLQRSMVLDDPTRRASFDAAELSASSDTESVSSGSNSDLATPARSKAPPRGIIVPARFWQETNSRLRRLPEPGTPLPTKPGLASPPGNRMPSPARGMTSPLRARGGSVPVIQLANAPSIISFAVEVRRAKRGENRIEEAHALRLLDNRHLQWRYANARADAVLLAQRLATEKNLYNARISISELRNSITAKRIKLQHLRQCIKLSTVLKGQINYLEEWSLLDRDHSSSLSGAIEALKASTLRLPVVGGAKADVQDMKESVGSVVDVMHTMGSSIYSLLSKVEGTSSLASELAKVAAQELTLLDQLRDVLSTVAVMHVRQCSLQGHLLQLK
ncbi:LOW QUALITY PROTEIN: QWRF motif-containing protein 2-like [Ananas comosus]|uniref:LOW QUALITY PROTEIN: QWRF motif-containing protein 2-like n=1 Tax=Ananas comosus TaxID=4615 RepID=A0A6P5G896_ANACO|nr:LOW QUALITY PROTEIN: QWRF motif-containing protein 2-like [Ananas comosus]